MVGRKVEASDSDSDSDAVASSSEASARSRASEAWATGDMKGRDRLRDDTPLPIIAIGLGGVGMLSFLEDGAQDEGQDQDTGPQIFQDLNWLTPYLQM